MAEKKKQYKPGVKADPKKQRMTAKGLQSLKAGKTAKANKTPFSYKTGVNTINAYHKRLRDI